VSPVGGPVLLLRWAMDDITNKRFDRVEERIQGVRAELKADLVELKTDLAGRIDNVARGLDATINSAIAAGFCAAADDRGRLHAETMHRFQLVIDEAERIGAAATRDRRVSELEAEVSDRRDRLARVEQALGTGLSGT
jgi:hypothetical protein